MLTTDSIVVLHDRREGRNRPAKALTPQDSGSAPGLGRRSLEEISLRVLPRMPEPVRARPDVHTSHPVGTRRDDLRTARGMMLGVSLGAISWGLIGTAGYLLFFR